MLLETGVMLLKEVESEGGVVGEAELHVAVQTRLVESLGLCSVFKDLGARLHRTSPMEMSFLDLVVVFEQMSTGHPGFWV